jgi:hypothetical protein
MSANPDHPSTMCYLDFTTGGKSHPDVNDGQSWDTWQVIHVTDHTGEPLKSFGYPADPAHPYETEPASFTKAKWHHPEYSNHPNYIVATVNADRYFANPDPNGLPYVNTKNQERIYLVDVADSAYLEVMRQDETTIQYYAKGGGLYWPGLWVDAGSEVELDQRGARRGGVMFEAGRVASRSPIRSVTVYRADGTVVDRSAPRGRVKTLELRSLRDLSTGTYFVRVETVDAGARVFRYLPVR